MTLQFSFDPLADSWPLVATLVVVFALAILTFSPTRANLTPGRKRVDLLMRSLLVLFFAFFFARPSLVRVEKEELPASVFFLCDLSESMTIEDEGEGRSRFDALRDAFHDAQDSLRQLDERFDAHVFAFSDALEETTIQDGVPTLPDAPNGDQTALGDSLLNALRASAGKRLVAMTLLSDGAQRAREPDAATPQDVALRYRDAEIPIVAVQLGSPSGATGARDVAVAEMRANDRVFLGNDLSVSGQIRALGYSGRELPVELSLETSEGEFKVVGRATVVPKSDDATIPYEFVCKPTAPGEWKYRVSTPVQQGETLDLNNAMDAFVAVVEGGSRALYIEGTRRYEQNFLRAALDSSSDVRARYWRPPISSLVGKTPNATEAEMVAQLAKSRKSLVEPFFSEGKFATYILGDVDATAFQREELEALAQRVEEGAGLIILMGERSLGLGGYAQTPLADALPIVVNSGERLPLDSDLSEFQSRDPDARAARIEGEFRATPPSDLGRDAFAVSLNADPGQNAKLWRDLPPLQRIYRLGRLKPNATVLLEATPLRGGGRAQPALVAHRYGLGRVAVLATDSTWRWRMRGAETEHAKFWRQLVMWTLKVDEALEGELVVELERARLAPGDDAGFQVAYRPKPGESLENREVEAVVVDPSGQREIVPLTKENGTWRGRARKTSEIGDYRIEAVMRATDGGDSKQSAQARFLVFAQNLELENPGASPETLEYLASTTQGKVLQPADFKAYVDELLQERETIADFREVKRSLYDTRAAFALFLATATIYWILRKRWGLA